MSVVALAETILVFVAIVGIGWLLRRVGILRREDARPINTLIIYVGLPAFIIRAVLNATLDARLIEVVAIAWAVFVITALAGWATARALRLPRTAVGAFVLVTAFGNTGYIGYPITQALLGADALSGAIFYDVFGTVAALLFVGLAIAERYSGSDERRKHPLREVLGFPAVIALAVGLIARGLPIPSAVSNGLALLASFVVPLILISVGISLDPGVMRRWAGPLAAITGLRLVVAPLLALVVGAVLFDETGDTLRIAVLQAGMPTMMLSLVVGARFELDTDLIASAIFVTTAASAVSIPLFQLLV